MLKSFLRIIIKEYRTIYWLEQTSIYYLINPMSSQPFKVAMLTLISPAYTDTEFCLHFVLTEFATM